MLTFRAAHGYCALGLSATLLLGPIGQHFRIDLYRCPVWPVWPVRLALCVSFLLCVGCLWFAWQKLLRLAEAGLLSLRFAAFSTVLWHGAALLSPPFLSDDPLFYLALGRALSVDPGAAGKSLVSVLGTADEVVRLLPPHWQQGQSAYQSGFHALAWLVQAVPGLSLSGRLTVYQAMSFAAVLGASALCARVVQRQGLSAAVGFSLVGLSPLAVLEATLSAHNDVWLLLCMAAFVFFRSASRRTAPVCLLLGLLIKLSALLPLMLLCAAWLQRNCARFLGSLSARMRLVLLFAAALAGFLLLLARLPAPVLWGLLGSPDAPWEMCTRSLECLPRAVLRYVFLRPDWSYAVGVVARFASGCWLLWVARPSQRASDLEAMAAGLFGYYLYFHGWAQTWYFLPLLPLQLHLGARPRRAFEALGFSGCGYYALALFRNCVTHPAQVALFELAEGLATVLPPTVILLRGRK